MQHLLYKSLTAALALTGCASLIVSGELNLLFILPGLAIFPGYYRYLTGKPPISRWLVAFLAVVEIFVLGFDTIFVTQDFLIAIAHMTIVFQALKSFDFHEPWDPLQVYFMSLLQLIITSDLSLSMAVGSVFIVFLFFFMAVLVVSHFMKEGTIDQVDFKRPMLLITIAAFIFTLVFFVSVPRVKSGIWGRQATSGIRTAGFSDTVDFSSFGDILEDDTIVMRVEIKGSRDIPLYWRGASLDSFDGVRWTNTFSKKTRLGRKDSYFTFYGYRGSLKGLVEQEVILEPLDTDVVFGAGEIVALKSKSWLVYVDRAGTITLPQKTRRRYSYTVYSSLEPSAINLNIFSKIKRRYLAVPDGMERVAALARQVSGSSSDTASERAARIEDFLLTEFNYSLKTKRPPSGTSTTDYFLFDSKTGFCQYFASSMVMMLRSIGIPSRMVTGYSGGEVNDFGNYVIVRQRNAHSWVEALINGRWTRFDPTPLASPEVSTGLRLTLDNIRMQWYRYVIGFSGSDQRAMVRTFTAPAIRLPSIGNIKLSLRPVTLLIIALVLAFVSYIIISRLTSRRKRSYETTIYMDFRAGAIKLGGNINDSSTSHEVFREAVVKGVDSELASEFIKLYEGARFGARGLDPNDRKRYEELVTKLSSVK
jgi:transglutaminase-like putative cysteine protease